MKQKQLLKTLLVAVCLLVGTSAWGETTLYERGTTNAWAATDVAEGAWSAGTIGTSGLEVTNSVASSIAIAPTDNTSILTWTATWNPGNATGTANSTNAYISFGDVTFAFYGSSWFTKVTIGSTTTQISNAGTTRGRDYIISVTINQKTNEVSYSFTDNNTTVTGTGTTAKAGAFTTLTHGLGGKSPNWTNTAILKTVKITEEENTAEVANYTVRYLCGETEVKNTVTRSGEVGSSITLQESDKANFYSSDGKKKYIYSGDDANSKTIASGGSTVITINFTEASLYTYSVKAVDGDGNDLGTIATSSVFSDETAKVAWSKYIKSGDQWYISKENSFYASSTEAGEKTVEYEKSDIAYFIECEKMNGVRSESDRRTEEYDESWSGNTKIRINRFASTFYTEAFPEGGVFNISIPYSNGNGSSSTYKTQLRDGSGNLTEIDEWQCETNTNNATYTLKNIVVPAGSSIAITCEGLSSSNPNSNARMDYLVLINSTVSTTVTSAGWATLYTPYALDFSSLSEDLTAYTASVSDGSVTLTQVQTVPANSGVVLKGKAKEYSIPVIASSETPKGDLQGSTTDLAYANFEANNSYYVLATAADNSGDVQFRKVTSGTIAEGKAYLKIANGNTVGAKALSVMFANDPTGIATVNASEAVQPAKRIVNGKLVIEKNGKRYNAAGAEF